MKIYPFKAAYPNLDVIPNLDNFLAEVKYKNQAFFNGTQYIQSDHEAYYVNVIESHNQTTLSITANTDIRHVINGDIKPHENTLEYKEEESINLLIERRAMVKPVLLAYKMPLDIKAYLYDAISNGNNLLLDLYTRSDNTRHRIYQLIGQEKITELNQLFTDLVPTAYIADGHHRCSTMATLNASEETQSLELKSDRLLTTFFDFDDLMIFPYNRIILMEGTSFSQLLELMQLHLKIKNLKKPSKRLKKNKMNMYLDDKWYQVRLTKKLKEKYTKDATKTDIDIFNTEILTGILGIVDTRNDLRIIHKSGNIKLKEFTDEIKKNTHAVGFMFNAVSVGEWMTICDMGKTLPPKSTWFEPRMKNGILVYKI